MRSSGEGTVEWQRPGREVARLFSFLGSDGGSSVRSTGGYLEDEIVTLLRGRLTSKNVELDVTLEATRGGGGNQGTSAVS